ncbi:unnamed protein product, partial [Rotaria socialis]
MKSKVLQASFRGKTNTMDRRTAATTTTPFRSQSTSTTNNKRNFNIHPKYFTTKASDISTDKTTN